MDNITITINLKITINFKNKKLHIKLLSYTIINYIYIHIIIETASEN